MEPYNIQPILWLNHKNAKGDCRLKLEVSIRSKRIYVQTPFLINPDTWDVLGHKVAGIPDESVVNDMIRFQVLTIDRIIRNRLAEGGPVTARFLNHMNKAGNGLHEGEEQGSQSGPHN